MRRKRAMAAASVLVAVGIAVMAGGCIPSLHPLYTEKELVFDPSIVGVWGKPVHGLKCRVEMVKSELLFGEGVQFRVTLANTTSEPISVIGPAFRTGGTGEYTRTSIWYPCFQSRIENADGRGFMGSWDDSSAIPTAVLIEPGKEWVADFSRREVERVDASPQPGGGLPMLRAFLPGEYTMQMTYFVRESEMEKYFEELTYGKEAGDLVGKKPDKIWKGIVRSRPVAFRVLKDDSEQLEILRSVHAGEGMREHLQLTLAASSTAVRAGEKVVLKLSAGNTGERTLYLGSDYALCEDGPRGRIKDISGLRSGVPVPIAPGESVELVRWRFGGYDGLEPGEYRVWVEYEAPQLWREPSGVLAKSNVVTIEVLEGTEAGWGEAVEGVQCRLRAEKKVWNAGEIPTFKAEIHSEGKAAVLGMGQSPTPSEVEFDGEWYPRIVPSMLTTYRPLEEVRRVPIELYGPWLSGNGSGQWATRPGTHKVRVAFSVRVEDGRKEIRVVSNLVEIEVLPAAEEEGQGEEIEGTEMHFPKDVRVKIGDVEFVYSGGDVFSVYDLADPDPYYADGLQMHIKIRGPKQVNRVNGYEIQVLERTEEQVRARVRKIESQERYGFGIYFGLKAGDVIGLPEGEIRVVEVSAEPGKPSEERSALIESVTAEEKERLRLGPVTKKDLGYCTLWIRRGISERGFALEVLDGGKGV
jgi:hypothetical protein